jgi:hypothetical protein
MEISTEHWLYSLEIIKQSKLLKETFEKEFKIPFNYDLIKASFKGGLLKDNMISRIEGIGAICLEINDKIFLVGETKGEFDLVGDNIDNQPLTELFDMTTEMKNGQSYSFYTSTVSFFKLANIEDCVKVNEFLKTLA